MDRASLQGRVSEDDGNRLGILENAHLRAVVDLDRGADLVGLSHRPTGREVLFQMPRRAARDSRSLPAEYSSTSSFFDAYPGGMQQIFPNGGPSCVSGGSELGFHGEACKVAWEADHREGPDQVEIVCRARLSRVPVSMVTTYSLGVDDRSLKIHATLRNESVQTVESMWGFHPAFGAAVTGGTSRLHAAAAEAEVHDEQMSQGQLLTPGERLPWPQGRDRRLDVLFPPEGPSADLFYLHGNEGWYVLANEDEGLAVTMTWDPQVFPYLWVWQECHDAAGYPWFGQHHIVAVEPWSSMPSSGLHAAQARGTALTLPGHATRETELRLGVSEIEPDRVPVGVSTTGRIESRE